ncbi:CARDB domain-containing protein [Haloarcula litorea]|uniref:CARDB domain-containing protein n=1 Tax=Haloarcula litorea TaxID=3032579 RepID=UPI0023E7D711|nr:CARDB domain-containing protein [Halomicroarcula sp. GDY20]
MVFRDVNDGTTLTPGVATGSDAPVALTTLGVTFGAERDAVAATVGSARTESGRLGSVERGTVVRYLPVASAAEPTAVGRVEYAVRVDERALPAASRDSLTLYRATGEGWRRLDTRTNASADRLRASADGVSSLAVVALTPGRVEVVATTQPPDWARRGYEASVTATVANPGDRAATRTLSVTVDGTGVANRTVTVAPGQRRNVTLSFPARSGTVAVGGVEAGSMSVGGGTAARTTAGASGPGFGAAGAAVALLVAAALARTRRR